MESHPYISGAGNISRLVLQLRKNFPEKIDASTLKKLSIAPNNESYLLNSLRFIGLLDEKGMKTPSATNVFSIHDPNKFAESFSSLIEIAYGDLFELHGSDSWTLTDDELISFFRTSDKTSDTIARRQAAVFQTFAELAGKREQVPNRQLSASAEVVKKNRRSKTSIGEKKVASAVVVNGANVNSTFSSGIGLSVRIEVNLPPNGTQETYNMIFKSIKENFLNGG